MGKWQFKRTPFGLSQAPAYFQLLIDKVLMGCSSFAIGYLDDIIFFSKTEEEHLQYLEEIFVRLRKFGLKMKREKCSFFKKHIQYIGHLVSEKGFEPLLEKLESIRKMPAPRTAKEVKQFLGLIGYYQKFVPHFTDISRPLTKLTHHNIVFEWTDQCSKTFNHLLEPHPEISGSHTRLHPVHRCKCNWMVGSAYTGTSGRKRQSKKPSHLLRKWRV